MTFIASLTAAQSMYQYVIPAVQLLGGIASLACVFFLVDGGIAYMTSRGKPDNLDHAKRVIKNAFIGLILVLGAATLTTILASSYHGTSAALNATLPQLQDITPAATNNSLIDIILSTITGFFNYIVQAVGAPFISALSFFTTSTPLMSDNSAVFNLWLAVVGITDGLFVLVVALLGFHVMSAATFGLQELDIKHLLPKLALAFLFMNISIFLIDGVIGISNAMITALNIAGGNQTVWNALTDVLKQVSGDSLAALLIMVVFLIFTVILLIYYITRLVTLFIGAVLSPLIMVLWIVPGFRDFSETAAKVYATTIFVLFVHVAILQLAASLFAGMIASSPTHVSNTIMAMLTGIATILALLKTQGVMNQLSYVSLGPRTARQLGGQFINAVSTVNNARQRIVAGSSNAMKAITSPSSPSTWSPRYGSNAGQAMAATSMTGAGSSSGGKPKPTPTVSVTRVPANANAASSARRATTGTTTIAPKIKPDLSAQAKVSRPISRDKGGKS